MNQFAHLNYNHLFYFWAVAHEGSMAAASEMLEISQPTVSTQIRKLERTLGERLFKRKGRGIALTEFGDHVFSYAHDMFRLSKEMVETASSKTPHSRKLMVGVPLVLPKLITFRLLEPVFRSDPPLQVIVSEAKLDELLAGMSLQKFDVILSDSPLTSSHALKAYNHLLGACGVTIFGTKQLVSKYRDGFPHSLHGAPTLLPTLGTSLRRTLDTWFRNHEIAPRIVGEFDDSALLKEFGHAGLGVFPAPSAIEQEIHRQFQVETIGRIPEVLYHFYAITTQRKIEHPAIQALSEQARNDLFDESRSPQN